MEINLKARTGSIELNSGHSLLGNKPEIISNEMFHGVIEQTQTKKNEVDFERFGLWETATPNYTTYYPDVSPEDLNPKEEDFIYPVFRALSATIVWKGYKPIDFSKSGVLKASMSLLVGQSINADHETALGNAMGSVKSTYWQEGYKVGDIKVPAGINAEFKIDGKSNPRIARGIMMNPPSIHSNSVSVRFKWEPSHSLPDNEFFNKLGTMDDKGQLYRLIVTEIVQYTETSLVSHGADAWAQKIGEDGKIVNPTYASGVYNFSVDKVGNKAQKYSHYIDYKSDLSLGLNADDIDTTILNELVDNNKNEENRLNMNVLEILTQKLGFSTKLTEENFSEKLQEFLDANKTDKDNAVSEVQAKLDTAEQEKAELKTELDTAKLKSDKFDELDAAARTEAKRLYKLAKGEKADEAILSMLDTVESKSLESLTKDYQDELDAKFPDSCKSCGSHEINKGSSFSEDEEEEDLNDKGKGRGTEKKILSNAEARAKLRESFKKNK